MATLEIDLAPEEQTQLEQKAQQAGLPVRDWVRHRLLHGLATEPLEGKSGVFFTTDDGEMIEIPGPSPVPGTSAPVRPLRPIGLCAGEFTVPDDFDDPLPEEILRDFEGR
jgi:hypothetical protein